MKSFLLTDKGQFLFDGQNALVMVSEDDELMQCVQQIITTNLGEWFLNPNIGWDRFNTLGQKPNEERTINDLIEAIITGEPRIAAVEEVVLIYDRPGRHLVIQYTVVKNDGTELEGEASI